MSEIAVIIPIGKAYDPNEARKPAGEPGGGEWAKGDRQGRRPGGDPQSRELFDGPVTILRRDGADEAQNKLFGRRLEDHEIADLAGAPGGATIKVGTDKESPTVNLLVEHPFYIGASYRRIEKAGKDGLSGIEIDNDGLHLRDEVPAGTGTRLFARQVMAARELGVKRITTAAVGSAGGTFNGYYTWARLGYDGEIPLSTWDGMDLGDIPGGQKISDLMSTQEGRERWKQHGSRFNGTFDLDPDSRSSRVLGAYLEAKEINP